MSQVANIIKTQLNRKKAIEHLQPNRRKAMISMDSPSFGHESPEDGEGDSSAICLAGLGAGVAPVALGLITIII